MRPPLSFCLLALLLGLTGVLSAQADPGESAPKAAPYGNNEDCGTFAEINGIKLYYETYGEGRPLLLIHGNSGSIRSMGFQISHFSKSRRVIVADSRGHGKSELGEGDLTYANMTADFAKLLAHLCIFPGQTHFAPESDPELFNSTVGRFFDAPFSRPESRDFFQGKK